METQNFMTLGYHRLLISLIAPDKMHTIHNGEIANAIFVVTSLVLISCQTCSACCPWYMCGCVHWYQSL